jgi:hypothetical protein
MKGIDCLIPILNSASEIEGIKPSFNSMVRCSALLKLCVAHCNQAN